MKLLCALAARAFRSQHYHLTNGLLSNSFVSEPRTTSGMAVNKKKAGSASFLDKQTYLRVNTYDGGKKTYSILGPGNIKNKHISR